MENKEKILTRLRRIEGQIRGIEKMIQEDRSCDAVLQQLSAARSGLFKVGTCYAMLSAITDQNSSHKDDIVDVLGRFSGSISKLG